MLLERTGELVRVLDELATAAAETLELQDLLERVAASVGTLIPLETMGVVRIVDGQQTVLHATTVPCGDHTEGCWEPISLDSWSPRWRPRPGPIRRIDDALRELDVAFPIDAALLGHGLRSSLWEPFRSGRGLTGGLWLWARSPRTFTDVHQRMLGPVAALVGSVVHNRWIWDSQRRRGERFNRLEQILGTLAEALDIRHVFGRLSDALQPVLPHRLVVLSERDRETGAVQVVAEAGTGSLEPPIESLVLALDEEGLENPGHEIIHNAPAELPAGTPAGRTLAETGMRSLLRVPVWLGGEVQGSLTFLDSALCRYDLEDIEIVRRVADRIALTLSHHRLAEEARVAVETRERAERLEATVAALSRELEARGDTRIVSVSRALKEVLIQVGRVAASETSVLITGETGSGKEIISRLIHQGSPRASRPLVAVNCAALPEQLLESELFGHERGAFTGAVATRIGRIEQAAGGTLFLDEVAEMSPLVQAKLLRVLEGGEYQRLGGSRTLRADVRLVAATNRDLPAAIARGQFREDLYYRLNVFHIHVVPLRERTDDILPLAESFMDDLGRITGRPAAGISRDARQWLLTYPWPGNVRELRNAIERAILLCDGGLITSEHLPAAVGRPATVPVGDRGGWLDPATPLPPGGVDLDEVERGLVHKALRQSQGNKSKAARLLGLTRAQLYSRIEKFGLDRQPTG